MTALRKFGSVFMDFINLLRSETLRWRLEKQDDLMRLRQQRLEADLALERRLERHRAELEQEIALLRTRNDAELEMLRARCRQDIRDYRQYLDSLDQLKARIQQKYRHLPEPVAFTIHHHARQLLNQMWDAEDLREKLGYEMTLLDFMAAVHQDTCTRTDDAQQDLPRRTLELIRPR